MNDGPSSHEASINPEEPDSIMKVTVDEGLCEIKLWYSPIPTFTSEVFPRQNTRQKSSQKTYGDIGHDSQINEGLLIGQREKSERLKVIAEKFGRTILNLRCR